MCNLLPRLLCPLQEQPIVLRRRKQKQQLHSRLQQHVSMLHFLHVVLQLLQFMGCEKCWRMCAVHLRVWSTTPVWILPPFSLLLLLLLPRFGSVSPAALANSFTKVRVRVRVV
jgi:hypothetical protein